MIMKRVILFGVSNLTRVLKAYLDADERYELLAFTVETDYIEGEDFMGLPVRAFESLRDYYDMESIEIIPAIAYSNMNKNREKVFQKCYKHKYKICTYLSPSVQNYADEIGEGCIILDGCMLKPYCRIGKGNYMGANTFIAHDVNVGDFNYFAGSNVTGGFTEIGSYNFLGAGAMVESGHRIGNENLLAAGVCVAENIEDNMVISPPPNRVKKASARAMDVFLMRRGENTFTVKH